MNKKLIIVILFVFGSFAVQAQNNIKNEPSKELKWETDINKAIEISNTTKKPMLMFFTGSDWCGWCIRLQKEVLLTPEFKSWAAENVILVELDFPRNNMQTDEIKAQNNGLQQAFGVQGFPTVWFTTADLKDGKQNFIGLGTTGYLAGGPSAWLPVAESFIKKK